ncbi:MAG TPA: bifunctional D-glycero-beta-D-manno-heptose-7-phosphate kinase/D-glycero-beta-D-manno-heptose 1-phosphate adenylyltransferase HldE [Salinisphaeraceae bacterium]|nr:bifunctional D-glycero-beta-D-manno-heptose-7-phosphate kinase/D-glycero-beta-D-manno-heptose 1-phosphate adenylyltransferase HldE [Salinisphaeraceae bacterium]
MLAIPTFDDARVVVAGDVMLDRYWHGDTQRISPEAPVPVVRIGNEEQRLGGAANVALNLARLGVHTTLIGVVGDDEAAAAVRRLLAEAGIMARLLVSKTHPTIDKLRVLSRHQQLIRLDAERSFAAADSFDDAAMLDTFVAALAQADAVIFSDYGKGSLAQMQPLIEHARAAAVPVLVDPKGDDWTRYTGATLLTPNLSEFELLAGTSADEQALAQAAQALRRQLDLQALLVTRSDKGMSLFSAAGHLHLPTLAQEVFDVTGAGDTVIALLAAGLAVGQDLADAAALANLAAGVVVAKLGTAAASRAELLQAARMHHRSEHNNTRGVVTEDQLTPLLEEARVQGEKVVLTNGCFDLLHPGHVAYLEAARALGDRLVVAVNDDASVARLKGAARPINPLAQRMQMLAALAAVDWVVPFAEDTPARLIRALQPAVLVKGGDYAISDIAGAEDVLARGGEVRVLDYVAGYSSTAMIERILHSARRADA